jgi:hypothetical protein
MTGIPVRRGQPAEVWNLSKEIYKPSSYYTDSTLPFRYEDKLVMGFREMIGFHYESRT